MEYEHSACIKSHDSVQAILIEDYIVHIQMYFQMKENYSHLLSYFTMWFLHQKK